MIIVTNPGSNLLGTEVERYSIRLTPQQIIVDGTAHDTRGGVGFEQIDTWVEGAKVHPYVVGTTAAEFVQLFQQVAADDRRILAVMTSRKIIGSHDAAVVAGNTLRNHPRYGDVEVTVVDSGVTDIGAGLACVLAAEARAAGKSTQEIVSIVNAYRERVKFLLSVETLDYLVKGGRATAFRAFFANLIGVRPIIGLSDGEVRLVDKVSTRKDPTVTLAARFADEVGAGRRVWAAVFHGGAAGKAGVLAAELRRVFDCNVLFTRAMAPSIYLHGGPGCVGAVVVPIDDLPWHPPRVVMA